MIRNLALVVAAVSALFVTAPVQAEQQQFKPMHSGQISFVMPSGNIECLYTPAGGTETYETMDGQAELICDRMEPSYVRVYMNASGAAERYNNPGEQPCCSSGPKFQYGNVWMVPEFNCWSQSNGLVCKNANEHGFLISRASIQVQ